MKTVTRILVTTQYVVFYFGNILPVKTGNRNADLDDPKVSSPWSWND